jgi:hypothetical protein
MALFPLKYFFISSLLLLSSLPSIADQVCQNYIPDLNPNDRYTDHNDGTVTDKKTGLMWKKCIENYTGDNCTGNHFKSTWMDALKKVASINSDAGFATYKDWRLPNITELESLVVQNCTFPSINKTVFPLGEYSDLGVVQWSSSPSVKSALEAWGINFENGIIIDYHRTNISRTFRLVRSGQ